MRSVHPLTVAVFCSCMAATAWAKDPTKVDPAKRNETFAPAATITAETRPLKRDDAVQSKRAALPTALVEPKRAEHLQDQRAPIPVTETRKKKVKAKEVRTFEKKDQPTNRWDEKTEARKPANDIRKTQLVSKYQDRMTAAASAAATRQPTVERRSSFDGLNRFVFRRNVASEKRPVAVPAGGGTPLRAQP